MGFWESIRGVQLANVLIRELPKLNRPRTQYTAKLPSNQVFEYIEMEIKNGSEFVSTVVDGDETLIIMHGNGRHI